MTRQPGIATRRQEGKDTTAASVSPAFTSPYYPALHTSIQHSLTLHPNAQRLWLGRLGNCFA